MSPGRWAFPPGRFSVAGTTPITFSFGLILATAFIAPKTAAEPHMSNFISSIDLPGLSEIPPESNVTPLPTTARVSFASGCRYSMKINLAGVIEPWETPSSIPMPSFFISFSSMTLYLSPSVLQRFLASSASFPGFISFAGVFPRVLAMLAETALNAPNLTALAELKASLSRIRTFRFFGKLFSLLL